MAFSYGKKNLANTTLVSSLNSSATSVTVTDASIFPGSYFYATLMPSSEISSLGNSEIVMVTNISGNVLTIIRAQRGTTARSFDAGAVITNGIYSQDLDMAQAVGKKIFTANWDDDEGYYKINDPMLKIVPDEGTSIRVVFDTDVSSGASAALSINENTESGTATKIGKNIEIRDANALPPVSIGLNGDTEQKTMSGKNLLPLTMTSQTVNNVVFTVNADGSIKALGTASARTEPNLYQSGSGAPALVLKSGTTYHNSMNTVLYFFSTTYRAIGANGNYTPSVDETVQYAYFRVENGESIDATLYPQLEKGSQGSAYEQYCGGTPSPNPSYPQAVEVVSGEQTITISDGGGQSQEYTVDLIGKNLFNKDAVLPSSWSNAAGVFKQIQLKPNTTYTMSSSIPLIGGSAQLFMCDSATSSPSTSVNGVATGKNVSVTTLADGIIQVAYRCTSGTITRDDYWYQIEEGSSATTYEPYRAYELCKIGDYQDYIYKSDDDWYIHKEITKIAFDSTTSWTADSTSGMFRLTDAPSSPQGADDKLVVISDQFTGVPANDRTSGLANMIYKFASSMYIRNTSFANTSAVVSHFTSKPAVAYYVMRTATDTQITDAGLIAQLEALASATLYEGQNNITVSGDLAGYLNLTYNTMSSGVYVASMVNGAYILDDDTRDPAYAKAWIPYDLTYYNGEWYLMNMVGEVYIPDNSISGDKITNGAITNGKIVNNTIEPGKLNFASSTHHNYYWSTNGSGNFTATIDVSSIPNGARFICFATGYVNLNQDGACALNMTYNNSTNQPTWADMKGGKGAVPMTNGGRWTKASANNQLTFYTTFANGLNDYAFNVLVWVIM